MNNLGFIYINSNLYLIDEIYIVFGQSNLWRWFLDPVMINYMQITFIKKWKEKKKIIFILYNPFIFIIAHLFVSFIWC
jgi:hypothetical protein